MARIFTAERKQQGIALRFVALACRTGQHLSYEDQPERRELANPGMPGARL
jgi:hypothetical protein